jgi:quercetin dioxygenase-like cupin family protein
VLIVAIIVLALFVGLGTADYTFAKEKAKKDPIRFKVLETYKTDLLGIEKAQLIKFEMYPGTEIKGFKCPSSKILWVTDGAFAYKYGDKTVERKKENSWFQDMETVLDVSNKGKDTSLPAKKGDVLISDISEPHGIKADSDMRVLVTIAPPI